MLRATKQDSCVGLSDPFCQPISLWRAIITNRDETHKAEPVGPIEPVGLKLYRHMSRAAGPLARMALRYRSTKGKEDPARIGERRGEAGKPRPDGPLIWIHGASVGESLSVLPLVDHLSDLAPGTRFLVTTGTVTSARLLEQRLPANAVHQFVPLDHPQFVDRFLNHWHPDAALFVESEFWPNLILKAREKVPFMALLNGRISPRSFEDWKRQANTIRFLLSSFDLILAQDIPNAERLSDLSGNIVETFGNLKTAAPALPTDDAQAHALSAMIGDRPYWLAASTHLGEESVVCKAHQVLKEKRPNALTILAPRHPNRADEVRAIVEEHGLSVAQRTMGEDITPATDVYLADTLGELGLFYGLCDVAFVGGGLTPKGGHNPLEPARLNCAILHGPHIFNFAETYETLRDAGGAALVRNERELAYALARLFNDSKTCQAMITRAQEAATNSAMEVLHKSSEALRERLPLLLAANTNAPGGAPQSLINSGADISASPSRSDHSNTE